MDKHEISSKLKEIIKPYVNDEEAFETINNNTDFLKDLKINSAHLIDIVLDVEEAFDVEIDDESMEKMITVGDSLDIIAKKLT